jgi:hypothetical protein
MPDIPEEAMRAAIEAIKTRCAQNDGAARWHALVALEAAAPVLAETIAQRILAHMEARGPAPEAPGVTRHEVLRRAWRRHFRIAAQVASRAFYTREDELRLAAEAIARGDFIACNPPEVPGER